jgi:hypothetical protein
MADKTEVSAKCEVKNIFDKSLSDGLQDAMAKTVQTTINKTSDFKFVSKTSKGFMLTVTVQSLTKKDSPAQLEVKIAISAVYIGGTAQAFNATANGKVSGTDSDSAEDLVSQVLEGVMKNVIKTMASLLKP